jgi:hypothetical protein
MQRIVLFAAGQGSALERFDAEVLHGLLVLAQVDVPAHAKEQPTP